MMLPNSPLLSQTSLGSSAGVIVEDGGTQGAMLHPTDVQLVAPQFLATATNVGDENSLMFAEQAAFLSRQAPSRSAGLPDVSQNNNFLPNPPNIQFRPSANSPPSATAFMPQTVPTSFESSAASAATMFGTSVPEKFPDVPVVASKWLEQVNKVYQQILESQADLQSDPLYQQIDISSCLREIRAPTVSDEIDCHVNRQMEGYEKRLDITTRKKLEAMQSNKRSARKISRFPCRVTWVNPCPAANSWSEKNILKRRRLETKLRTYVLAHDFKDSKFKKFFVSSNYAIDAHGVTRRQLEREHEKSETARALTPVSHEEVVVTISFYQPIRGIKMAEFDILGSQTLADLRDAFFCDEDVNFGVMKYKGACFFINGVFYADTRDPEAPDYSHWLGGYLAKWSADKVKQRTAGKMHLAKISLIHFMLNQRCAFLHQGDCEHRVTFTSVRKFDQVRDCPYLEGYPVRTYAPMTKTTMCQVCTVMIAQRLTFNSSLLPHNPTYLCRMCCDALLYDEKGQRIENDDFIQFEYQDVV